MLTFVNDFVRHIWIDFMEKKSKPSLQPTHDNHSDNSRKGTLSRILESHKAYKFLDLHNTTSKLQGRITQSMEHNSSTREARIS